MAYGFVSRQNVRSTVRGGDLQPATTSYLGGVKVDGVSITINDGVISAMIATSTASVFGINRPDNTSLTVSGGVLSVRQDVVRTMAHTQTFTGSETSLAVLLTNAAEKTTVTSNPVAPTAGFYVTDQSVMLHTSNQTQNWTLDITGNAAYTLNYMLNVGQSITVVQMVTQGSTAYYCTAVYVDGDPPANIHWLGGTAPSAGVANGVDVYTYTIVKTADDVFTVFASLTSWG